MKKTKGTAIVSGIKREIISIDFEKQEVCVHELIGYGDNKYFFADVEKICLEEA